MFVLVYVDDIIVASSSQEATNALLMDLKKEFALTDLRDLHYFLGIGVTIDSNELVLSQKKYAEEVIRRAGMNHSKPVSTQLSTVDKFSAHAGEKHGAEDAT